MPSRYRVNEWRSNKLHRVALILLAWFICTDDDPASNFAAADSPDQVDCTTLKGKVMCGYQGWFNCNGDGMNRGWMHWSRNRKRSSIGPGDITVDLWPGVSELHEILTLANVISPWTPGRYRNQQEVVRHPDHYWKLDARSYWEAKLDYLPVVFPGFSWHNLKQGESHLGEIPRQRGEFLWSQIVAAKRAGAEMLYVAMFDEVDEGTVIFKCTNGPPVGDGVHFLSYEGLPSDHYLKLVGQGGKLLRGEVNDDTAHPPSAGSQSDERISAVDSIRSSAAQPAINDLSAQSRDGDSQPLVLAYYYPWYHAGDWSRHEYAGTPKLGTYGTDSPKVSQQHISWCADHGINGLFVSWWGKDHLTEKHLNLGLLKAANVGRTQFALFYESLGLLDAKDGKRDGVCDFSKPEVLNALIDDFQFLATRYFDHPQYLKLLGRPVVGMYVTRTFRNFTKEHLDQVRKAIDSNVYVIADEVFIGQQASPETARHRPGIFDAHTAYNMFENINVRDDDTALTFQSREAFPIFRTWAKETTFIPTIFPSYKDFRGHKPLPGTPADFATLLDKAKAIASRPNASTPPIILITSFNEWWEGTTIEPAEEYGTEYLNVIQQLNQ